MRSTTTVTTGPRYGVLDVAALLLRELVLMIVIFLVIFVLGAAAALMLPKTYTASASLFVSVGREYVYQPRPGEQPPGQAPEINAITQSEAAIFESDDHICCGVPSKSRPQPSAKTCGTCPPFFSSCSFSPARNGCTAGRRG